MTDWAVVLGASSGFGAASAIKLAAEGLDICGVHLDSRTNKPAVDRIRTSIEAFGRRALLFNKNVAHEETRHAVINALKEQLPPGERVRVVLHSVAFGVTRALLGDQAASMEDLMITTRVMGLDVAGWTQALLAADLLAPQTRILAVTSEGSQRCWAPYGPVSAAKASLEAVIRQLAVELAPYGMTANCILAGVSNTPALGKIPGHQKILALAEQRNPHHRLTRPDDVAAVVSLLCDERASWITGSVVRCDGGEGIAS